MAATMAAAEILILTALEFEARPIARRLGLRYESRTIATGILKGLPVRLCIVGPRAAHLPAVPPAGTCRAVIMAGLAGALVSNLKQGDVILDEHSDQSSASPAPRLPIATVQSLAATPAEKEALALASGAHLVDMENAVARAWTRRHGIPFFGIRIISDTSAEALDPATLRVLDGHGFLRPSRLFMEVLRRPPLALTLFRLRSTRTTAGLLAENVYRLISDLFVSQS